MSPHPVRVRTSEGWQDVGQGTTGPPGPPGAGVAPPGVLMPFAGSVAPTGFLFCDGTAVSRVTYADLFAVIGTAYGAGDGSTTFNLPNMKGRVPVGVDVAQTEFDVLGEAGGVKTLALSEAQMPSHSHVVNSHGHGGGWHGHGWSGGENTDHSHGQQFLYNAATAATGGGVNVVTSIPMSSGNTWSGVLASQGRNVGHVHDVPGNWAGLTNESPGTDARGSGTAHNNLQPYLAVNWIIKT